MSGDPDPDEGRQGRRPPPCKVFVASSARRRSAVSALGGPLRAPGPAKSDPRSGISMEDRAAHDPIRFDSIRRPGPRFRFDSIRRPGPGAARASQGRGAAIRFRFDSGRFTRDPVWRDSIRDFAIRLGAPLKGRIHSRMTSSAVGHTSGLRFSTSECRTFGVRAVFGLRRAISGPGTLTDRSGASRSPRFRI